MRNLIDYVSNFYKISFNYINNEKYDDEFNILIKLSEFFNTKKDIARKNLEKGIFLYNLYFEKSNNFKNIDKIYEINDSIFNKIKPSSLELSLSQIKVKKAKHDDSQNLKSFIQYKFIKEKDLNNLINNLKKSKKNINNYNLKEIISINEEIIN